MSELLLIPDLAHPTYEDGDILCAFSERRIAHCHTEKICHPKRAPRSAVGYLARGSLAEDFQKAEYQFRFERDGQYGVRKVDVDTDAVLEVATVQQVGGLDCAFWADGTHMYVGEYLRRRKAHARHRIFGDAEGAEVWYGKSRTPTGIKLNAIWDRIEAVPSDIPAEAVAEYGGIPFVRTARIFRRWPLTFLERCKFLPVRFRTMSDAIAAQLTEPFTVSKNCSVVSVSPGPNVGQWDVGVDITTKNWFSIGQFYDAVGNQYEIDAAQHNGAGIRVSGESEPASVGPEQPYLSATIRKRRRRGDYVKLWPGIVDAIRDKRAEVDLREDAIEVDEATDIEVKAEPA